MIRVVFDTNVLYSAILKRTGQEAKAFNLVAAGVLIPCVSDAVLREYREVLFRPDLAVHAKRASEVLAILDSVALHVVPTEDLKISGHGDDNRIYECAAAAMADYIVTGNTKHFKEPYKNTLIVTARQLLELVGK
jgi:putative PIN family toxin of toxin-antitoxin system